MSDYSSAHSPICTTPGELPTGAMLAAFRPALERYFRRKLHDRNDVEDMVQEVYLRIAARQGGQIENFGGYLFRTAASVLGDSYRRRTVRHANWHVPFDCDLHGGTDFDSGHIVESREALRAVAAALAELSDRTRQIFLMRRLEGRAYRDIAASFEISISAVEKHMVRAVAQLSVAKSCAPRARNFYPQPARAHQSKPHATAIVQLAL